MIRCESTDHDGYPEPATRAVSVAINNGTNNHYYLCAYCAESWTAGALRAGHAVSIRPLD